MQVPIIDPQIHIKKGYAPYNSGIQQDVFVKDISGNNYVGQVGTTFACLCKALQYVESEQSLAHVDLNHARVLQLWAGSVHFPDFSSNATVSWWTSQMQTLYGQLPFDGIWIDMNEPSNFCTGDVCSDPGKPSY